MRAFLVAVGILAWLMALAVLLIFAQAGGALTVIAAGVFAVVAVVHLVVSGSSGRWRRFAMGDSPQPRRRAGRLSSTIPPFPQGRTVFTAPGMAAGASFPLIERRRRSRIESPRAATCGS